MSKNPLTKDEMKVRVLKLKKMLFEDPHPENEKELAHQYLNRVLDILGEYRV